MEENPLTWQLIFIVLTPICTTGLVWFIAWFVQNLEIKEAKKQQLIDLLKGKIT